MRLPILLLTILFAWPTHAQMTLRNGALRNYVGTSWDKNLVNGLVSYWKLDETSGTRYDAYSTNHLTANNSPGYTTGKVSNAATFDAASSQSLSKASGSSLRTGPVDFTIAVWCYPTSSTPVSPHGYCVVAKDSNVTGSREYTLLSATAPLGNKAVFIVYKATDSAIVAESFVMSSNNWHFLVGWHSTADKKVYLQVDNGTVFQSSAYTGDLQPAGDSNFRLGGRDYVGYLDYFPGTIDECGFWKRVLTAAERTQLYKAGTGTTFPTFSHRSRRIPESLLDTPANPLLAALYRKPEPISLDIP